MYILTKHLEFMWLFNYIIGYLMGKYNVLTRLKKINIILYSTIAIISCIIKVIIENINLTFEIGKIVLLYDYFFHIFLGFALVCIIYWIEKQLHVLSKLYKFSLIRMLDNNSYEIYLVHQIFILGDFSILNTTYSIFTKILLLILLIFTCARIINIISNAIICKVEFLIQ